MFEGWLNSVLTLHFHFRLLGALAAAVDLQGSTKMSNPQNVGSNKIKKSIKRCAYWHLLVELTHCNLFFMTLLLWCCYFFGEKMRNLKAGDRRHSRHSPWSSSSEEIASDIFDGLNQHNESSEPKVYKYRVYIYRVYIYLYDVYIITIYIYGVSYPKYWFQHSSSTGQARYLKRRKFYVQSLRSWQSTSRALASVMTLEWFKLCLNFRNSYGKLFFCKWISMCHVIWNKFHSTRPDLWWLSNKPYELETELQQGSFFCKAEDQNSTFPATINGGGNFPSPDASQKHNEEK